MTATTTAPDFLNGVITPGAYTEGDRIDLRHLAIHMLIDNHRLERQGRATRMHLLLHVNPALNHAAEAGWDRGAIHIEADRTWGQWLIDNAGQPRKQIAAHGTPTADNTTTDRGLRDAAVHALVTHDKQTRAGMATPNDFGTIMQRALAAGWASGDISADADRRYGQWLIAGADRDEQGVYATTFEELAAKYRALIGRIIGQTLPAGLHSNGFIAAVCDAGGALPDTGEWAYDRECLNLAADYLGDALTSEDGNEGAVRAADEALALVDIDGWARGDANV